MLFPAVLVIHRIWARREVGKGSMRPVSARLRLRCGLASLGARVHFSGLDQDAVQSPSPGLACLGRHHCNLTKEHALSEVTMSIVPHT
jgi:hypothetical protein